MRLVTCNLQLATVVLGCQGNLYLHPFPTLPIPPGAVDEAKGAESARGRALEGTNWLPFQAPHQQFTEWLGLLFH